MIHLRRLEAHNFKQLERVDLVLPRRATILVQGPNESGKSTIFEAVYVALFGRPLDQKRLDECIQHGAEEAYLRLALGLADGREMRITRRLRHTRSVYELEIEDAEGHVEELRGGRAIAERIEAELGFDGDAMLDTCFVEQKKLGKLEGMTLAQRERSLMKLLNLDRLVALGDELKVGRDDEHRVERLKRRLELARVQARLPRLEAAYRAAAARLARAEARDALHATAERVAEVQALAERQQAASEAAAELGRRAAHVEQAREGLRAVAEGRTAVERAAEAAEARRQAAERVRLAEEAAETVPRVTRRGKGLRRLARRLAFLDRLAAERQELLQRAARAEERLRELGQLRATLNETRQRLASARAAEREATTRAEELANDLRAVDVRRALQDWSAARAGRDQLRDPEEAITARRAAAAHVVERARLQLAVLAAGTLSLAGAGAWLWRTRGLLTPAVLVLWGVAALALLWTAARAYGAWRRHQELSAQVAHLEGAATVHRERAAALRERLSRGAERLRQLGTAPPGDVTRAAEDVQVLEQRIAGRDRAELEAAHAKAVAERHRASATIEAATEREAELRAAAGPGEAEAHGEVLEASGQRAERIAQLLARRRPALERMADDLETPLDAGTIEQELGALRAELVALRNAAASGAEARQAVQRATELGAGHRTAAATAWARLPEAARAVEAPAGIQLAAPPDKAPAEGRSTRSATPPATPPTTPPTEAWQEAEEALRAQLEAAGGMETGEAHAKAEREAAALAARLETAERRRQEALAEVAERLAALPDGPPPPSEATTEALRAARQALWTEDEPERPTAEHAEQREEAVRLLDISRHERQRLERELGLGGEVLAVERCEAELRRAERDIKVRRHATDIVHQAARNVMRQVIPSTIEHMRQLLPTLTAGRYFDAQLTDDIQIQVYDERAGDWLRKGLFSGGARDQMSLALRLAFALATLPEERGAAPGFLFLDEPLGAFDDERSRALVSLLTEGEVRESFDQIFLISHVRVDPSLFSHRIRMDEGRVAETTTPPSAARSA